MDAVPLEELSPELVLVDPENAASVREALEVPADTLESLRLRTRPSQHVPARSPEGRDGNLFDPAAVAALHRIVELADEEPPSARRTYRTPKLAGALATWAMVVVMAFDTGLYALVAK